MASSFIPYIPLDGGSATIKLATTRVTAVINAASRNNTSYPYDSVAVDIPKYTLFAMIRQTSLATMSVTALNSSAEDFGYGVYARPGTGSSNWTYVEIQPSDEHSTNIPTGSTHVESFLATDWILITESNDNASISQGLSFSIALSDRYNHRNELINYSHSAFNFEILFATADVG